MNACCRLATLVMVVLALARPAAAAEPGKGLTNPFFPYCVNQPDKVLVELGYAPMHDVYTGINLDKEPACPPGVKDQIRKLKGSNTVFWLTVLGNKAKPRDAQVVDMIRDLAAVAESVGVKIALYPHSGFYVATAEDALRIARKVDRKNVGLSITLCHELMQDNGDRLPEIVRKVAPHLFVVTINGADKKAKGKPMGWDRMIRPLGQGDFDVYAFLREVKAVGFQGPIGLQCYGLKGDPLVHLRQSIATWKQYCQRMAAEK